MYDQRKKHELENKSHVRGKLNKQFYSAEQDELERKRREMRAILDQQVEEKKRQKQRQKMEQQKRMREEEERISKYYSKTDSREKVHSNPHSNSHGSRVNENQNPPFEREQQNRRRINSRNHFQTELGDIPVMPDYNNSDRLPTHQNSQSSSPPQSNHKNSAGNIPLLELSEDELRRQQKKRVKTKTFSKRDSKERDYDQQKYSIIKNNNNHNNNNNEKERRKRQRKSSEEDSLPGSRKKTELKEIFGDINEEIEEENNSLRDQLKKNKEALTLLIGAVKSNTKLDKFRVQAERIIYGGQSSLPSKREDDSQLKKPSTRDGTKKEKNFKLPELKIRHQSIMQDYILGNAKRAYILKAKTFK